MNSNTSPNSHAGVNPEHQVREVVSVIIVGAGPTGLSAGNLLGLAGIDTLIIESNTFNQPEFEATLLEGLERFTCVNVLFRHTVESFEQTESGVIVTLRTPSGMLQKVWCNYLLACDGGRSTIRRMLNIPMKGTTFAQKWLVVDVIDDEESSPIAMFFCNPSRPTVTVPSPHKGRRWEFMLLPGEIENDLLRIDSIATLIKHAGGSPHSEIIRQTIYTFHSTIAQNFSKGRVFLLGDAAHMMPPFGGQGLNSGLRDAHNLCWKLAMVLYGLASDGLLDTYHEERHRHVAQMIRFSSFLGSIVMSTNKPAAYCRDIVFHLLNQVQAIREILSEGRMGTTGNTICVYTAWHSSKRGIQLSG
ncbi:MAG: hypothetical protein E6I97_14850 [Chloroflexi bacterium]|nr:MAG: hypothetical protein E6I97_14850 [Chloroflexota bacterium]